MIYFLNHQVWGQPYPSVSPLGENWQSLTYDGQL